MTIPSIGDSETKKVRRVKGQAQLPKSRNEVASTILNILNQGGVQKVTVELGKPIVFERLVKEDDATLPDLPEAPEEDPFVEVRNAEMLDYPKKVKSFFEYFFKAFALISQRRLKPRSFLVNPMSTFNFVLGIEEMAQTQEAFGLPVFVDQRLPAGVALLTATTDDEDDRIVMSVRLTLD